jgi:hypothetical protein
VAMTGTAELVPGAMVGGARVRRGGAAGGRGGPRQRPESTPGGRPWRVECAGEAGYGGGDGWRRGRAGSGSRR